MNEFSSLLFARPSFVEGAARVLDLANSLTEYNRSLSASQADELALHADWHAIGADIRFVIEREGEAVASVKTPQNSK